MFLAPNTFLTGTVVSIKNPPALFPIGWNSGMPGKYMGYDAAWTSVGAPLSDLLLETLVGWLDLQAITA